MALNVRAFGFCTGLAFAVCVGQASASTIDLAPPDYTFGPSYSQGGYTFTGDHGSNIAFANWAQSPFSTDLPFNASNSNGDIVDNFSVAELNTITNDAGHAFGLSTIGLADIKNGGSGGIVDFSFTHANGTVDTTSVTLLTGIAGLQTFSFNESNLTSVTFNSTTNVQFDNVGVSTMTAAVPEPSTWAMMILGFVGLGFMAYRRKSKPVLMAA
jgi:hypothetical protein